MVSHHDCVDGSGVPFFGREAVVYWVDELASGARDTVLYCVADGWYVYGIKESVSQLPSMLYLLCN